jgi:hypothetical protein
VTVRTGRGAGSAISVCSLQAASVATTMELKTTVRQ